MDLPGLQKLAPPAVTLLVSFLAHSSQWLFANTEPGRLRKGDEYLFNFLVGSLLICYWRTCFTDPGRIPRDWHERVTLDDAQISQRQRWCRKCDAYKPPRAHHCKTCKRCVPKMDHHCVWTANCVSITTYPHFIRFLLYAVISMIYLAYFLYIRCALIWSNRRLPSYLGPSVFQFVHLFLLVVTNSLVLFALVLLLGRTIWSTALNMTTIESWELERHHTLLRRARVLGGYLYGPDGKQIRIEHQEFPWDVGIWDNFVAALGTRNILAWAWPLARTVPVERGFQFEHNGIDDPGKPWPPPDPDRLFRVPRRDLAKEGNGFTKDLDVDAFRERQRADLARYADADGEFVVRRKPFHERLEEMQRAERAERPYSQREPYDPAETAIETDDESEGSGSGSDDEAHVIVRREENKDDGGEEAWRNKEGERLADFGVDEVAEFYDEDDLPLAEIIRRRKAEQN